MISDDLVDHSSGLALRSGYNTLVNEMPHVDEVKSCSDARKVVRKANVQKAVCFCLIELAEKVCSVQTSQNTVVSWMTIPGSTKSNVPFGESEAYFGDP